MKPCCERRTARPLEHRADERRCARGLATDHPTFSSGRLDVLEYVEATSGPRAANLHRYRRSRYGLRMVRARDADHANAREWPSRAEICGFLQARLPAGRMRARVHDAPTSGCILYTLTKHACFGATGERDMAARKKVAGKPKAKAKASTGDLIISKSRTKAATKKCNVGSEFLRSARRRARIDRRRRLRAQGNKRKTLKAVDL